MASKPGNTVRLGSSLSSTINPKRYHIKEISAMRYRRKWRRGTELEHQVGAHRSAHQDHVRRTRYREPSPAEGTEGRAASSIHRKTGRKRTLRRRRGQGGFLPSRKSPEMSSQPPGDPLSDAKNQNWGRRPRRQRRIRHQQTRWSPIAGTHRRRSSRNRSRPLTRRTDSTEGHHRSSSHRRLHSTAAQRWLLPSKDDHCGRCHGRSSSTMMAPTDQT